MCTGSARGVSPDTSITTAAIADAVAAGIAGTAGTAGTAGGEVNRGAINGGDGVGSATSAGLVPRCSFPLLDAVQLPEGALCGLMTIPVGVDLTRDGVVPPSMSYTPTYVARYSHLLQFITVL